MKISRLEGMPTKSGICVLLGESLTGKTHTLNQIRAELTTQSTKDFREAPAACQFDFFEVLQSCFRGVDVRSAMRRGSITSHTWDRVVATLHTMHRHVSGPLIIDDFCVGLGSRQVGPIVSWVQEIAAHAPVYVASSNPLILDHLWDAPSALWFFQSPDAMAPRALCRVPKKRWEYWVDGYNPSSLYHQNTISHLAVPIEGLDASAS